MNHKKTYVFNGDKTMMFTDTNGISREFNPGQEVILTGDGTLIQLPDHSGVRFRIEKAWLKHCFKRIWSDAELERYERIHEQAMIAAMQSLIANLKDKPGSPDVEDLEKVPMDAIFFADRIIEELKAREE